MTRKTRMTPSRKQPPLVIRTSTAALLAAAMSAGPAHTAEFVWDGSTGSPNWDAADGGSSGTDFNWQVGSGGGIPDADDTLLFDDTATSSRRRINLNGDRSVLSITFDSSTVMANPSNDPSLNNLNYLIDLDASSGANTLSLVNGDITVLDGNARINSDITLLAQGDWSVASGSTLTLAGELSAGTQTLIKTGAGTVNLTGGGQVNSLSISAGTFTTTGGTFQVNNALSGSGILQLNSGSALTTGGDGVNSTFSGSIQGNGSLTKAGSGTLALTGANTYSGVTTINAGTLQVSGGSAISNSGAVVVGSNGELFLGSGEIIGSLAGSGDVSLSLNRLTIANTGSTTFSGDISGFGNAGVTINGSGTQTFSGANTYTGPTTITAGTLSVSGGSAINDSGAVIANGTFNLASNETIGNLAGSGNVTLGANTLTIAGLGSANFSGAISGSGGLTINSGIGNQTLSGANTYTGPTTITSGILTVSGGSAINDSGTVIANGIFSLAGNETIGNLAGSGSVVLGANTLTIAGSGSTNFGGVISGTGGVTVNSGTGNQTLSGANTYTGPTTITAGTLTASGGSAIRNSGAVVANGTFNLASSETIGSLAGSGSVTLGANTLTITDSDSTTFSGAISGTGGVTINDGAAPGNAFINQRFTGANTYTGPTTITSGTLTVGGGSAINDAGAVVIDSNGLLLLADGEAIGSLAGSGSVTMTSASTILTIAGSDTTTFSGRIGGSGGLTLSGSGTQTLSGVNAYIGPTTIGGASTLSVSGGSAINDAGAVIANGTLNLASSETIGSLAGTGSVTLGANTLTIAGSSTTTFGGVISGAGALTLNGSGTQTLSGANTYTGATTLGGTHTLRLANAGGNTLANTADVAVGANATLEVVTDDTIGGLSGAGDVFLNTGTLTITEAGSYSGAISGSGGLTFDVGSANTYTLNSTLGASVNTYSGLTTITSGTLSASGGGAIGDASTVVTNGTFSLASSETIGSLSGSGGVTLGANTLTLAGSGASTFSGVISGTGGVTVNSGTGTQTLSGANTYTGLTTITSGTLTVSGGNAIRDGGAVVANGTLSLASSETIGSLSGSGTVALGANTLTVDVANNTSTTFGGALTGSGGLTKTGRGTLRLTGNNVASGYTGFVNISAGTVSVTSPNNLGSASVELSGGNASSGTLNFESDLTLTNAFVGTRGRLTTSGANTINLNSSVFQLTNGLIFGNGTTASNFILTPTNVTLTGGHGIVVADKATLVFGNEAAATTGSRQAIVDGTLDLNGFDAELGLLGGFGLVTSNGGDATVTATGNISYNGTIADGAASVVGLTVDAAGSASNFRLTRANTYSGITTVAAGTLEVTGSSASISNTEFLRVTGNGSSFLASNGATVKVANDVSVTGNSDITVTGVGTLFEANDSIFLNGSTAGVLNVKDGATFRILAPTTDRRFFIGSQPNQKGIVNVTGGATFAFANNGADPFRTFIGFQTNGNGEFNINTGGIVTLGRTDVGTNADDGSATGVINVDGVGSTLNIVQTVTGDSTGNGAGDLMLGSGDGHGVLNITNGGTVNIEDDLFATLGSGSSSEITITDGTLDIEDGLFIAYRNDGSLTVGADATIEARRFIVTTLSAAHADVTFQLTEDASGDPLNGLIDVTDISFRDGTRDLLLDLDDTATFEFGDTFVLIDYETRGANGYPTNQVFDNVGDDSIINFGGVDFFIDYNDPNFSGTALTATVIPEPASLVLLGLGGLCLLGRRRSRPAADRSASA